MAIETGFILGAGASRADGAPLQSELFGAYQRALNGPESIQAKMDNEIASFFQAFFGVDLTSAKFDKSNLPTFEEVLGIIEIALERGESFRDFGVDPSCHRSSDVLQADVEPLPATDMAQLRRRADVSSQDRVLRILTARRTSHRDLALLPDSDRPSLKFFR
jgi:hypothetical protein